jgi:hypothetical protein
MYENDQHHLQSQLRFGTTCFTLFYRGPRAVTLLVFPSLTKNLPCEKHSDRSTVVRRQEPGALQWRSDQDWETWDKLDISGTSCWCQRRRYLVPLRTKTNNTSGSQYLNDVAHVESECSCPHLASSNQSVVYTGVFRQLRYITAIQTLPHGIAGRFFHASTRCCVSSLHPCSIRTTLQYDIL